MSGEVQVTGETSTTARRRLDMRWLVDLGAIALLLLVGVTAWAPSFLGGRAWLAGV